jgi:drug/metabolite transporter (DMT)-like permease
MKEEFLGPRGDFAEDDEKSEDALKKAAKDRMLLISFCLMLVVGLMNKIFNKLMTIPMYNYPNTLNLLTTFWFVILCFCYIIPMARSGKIPQDQLDMPRKPFAIMGGLDALAGIMQIFAATYLPGPLLILLQQAAIPVSMVISRYLLNAQYNKYQYLGAFIVAAGIAVVLAPTMNGGGSPLWAIVMIVSCVPMTLSSVYKEIALGAQELDPMYLNGWIAVFQFLFSLALCLPAAMASEPPVYPADLPENIGNGFKCYVGENSKVCADDDGDDDTPCSDECYPTAPIFVTVYLFVNFMYNVLILFILKYGSANLLWLAMTLMVPLGNVAFTLDFMPQHSSLLPTDIIGLVVICVGLGCYRFLYDALIAQGCEKKVDDKRALSLSLPGEGDDKRLLSKLMEDSANADERLNLGNDGVIQ